MASQIILFNTWLAYKYTFSRHFTEITPPPLPPSNLHFSLLFIPLILLMTSIFPSRMSLLLGPPVPMTYVARGALKERLIVNCKSLE